MSDDTESTMTHERSCGYQDDQAGYCYWRDSVVHRLEADLARVGAALEKAANIVECLVVNEAQVKMFNWEGVLAEMRAALEGRASE